MVALFFSERSDAVDEIQRLLEVGKLELAMDVMFVFDRPLRNTLMKLLQVSSLERRISPAAGYALFVGELFSHDSPHETESYDDCGRAFTPAATVIVGCGLAV